MQVRQTLFVLAFLTAPLLLRADDGDVQRRLYVTSPDAAGGQGGRGIYVFDIDNDHRLVKRIRVPEMLGGTRGCCGSAGNGRLYVSHSNTDILCFDIATEKVIWNRHFSKEEGGADRCCVTPDGKKVYVPEGWWSATSKSLKVLDGDTGKTIKVIPLNPDFGSDTGIAGNGHNSFMSASGRRMYVGSTSCGWMFAVDTATDKIVHKAGAFQLPRSGPYVALDPESPGINKGRVSPYCINGRETRCYVNTARVGFFIGDVVTGKVLHWEEVTDARGFSHGVGITPGEKEIWLWGPERGPLTDADGKRRSRSGCLYLYDATTMPPRHFKDIKLRRMTHGWITFSMDGKYAYPDTLEVIDAKSKEIIGQLRDAKDAPLASSKFIEVHLRGGKVVAMGEQFGNGYVGKPHYLEAEGQADGGQ
jgi:hypothetical protein